ncbi:hypothetical protein COCMIDRAFT_81025 [Bipolaris oryzae ATCC 44560]|uniref:Uncharacterized protein n=1 Tax=Bipolaris oryzae ATCC 44560 TaxID=930090 RepID=W6ZLC9_COCMI|nr:uncharacterized protein COCMIDRAFT_81025 [Bipolaris oryzae ATCC 44560]EUC50753.1 hypothetical protein COCMIDRAFT_81025 [Bipolaris oryzae ATCC 44560]
MADKPFEDLNYGYPGTASYDLENSEWLFGRQYTTKNFRQIRTSDGLRLANTLATTPVQLVHPQTSANKTSTQEEVRNLVQDIPELAAAAALLPDLGLVSAAISKTTSVYDPLVGSLLSFGSITLGDRYENARQVAALPVGEAGNILQLAVLNKERLGWGMIRKTWIDGSTLREAEKEYWNEDAAPIQQICFSQSEDRSSLLAVRLPTRTVLFHPICFRQARPNRFSPFYDLPASTIDIRPIFSIDKESTGGFAHCHVAFNPSFQSQFAIVDQSATWSVWEIGRSRKSEEYTPSCLVRGRITSSEPEDVRGEDGWARVFWVADVNTLLVCNRRHLSIVSLKGGEPKHLACPTFLNQQSAEWFLDAKLHPKHSNQVFILTSTHLILVLVNSSVEESASAEDSVTTVLASWTHFRDADDFTLQITVQMLSEDESCLVLYSQLDNLIQVYAFAEHPVGGSSMVTCSDPGILELAMDGSGRIADLYMEPMQQGGIRMDTDFFRLFVVLSTSSIHELVIYTAKSSTQEPFSTSEVIEDFTRSMIRHPRVGISKTEVVNKEDEMIVPDGLDVLDVHSSKTPSRILKPDQVFEDTPVQTTRNNELLYEALQYAENPGSKLQDSLDVTAVLGEVKQMLADDPDSVPLPIGTLMEYADTKLQIPNVDEASSNLQDLFVENEENALFLQRIASAQTLGLAEEDNDLTISDIYDTLLEMWVAPLPPTVPSRVRQSKEQLARGIAAEVIFSSLRIREHELEAAMTDSRLGPSQDRGIALPILPSRPRNGDFHFPSQFSLAQQLPTPPQSSVPPSSLPGSSPPVVPFTQNVPQDPLARLSKHLRNRNSSKDSVGIGANASRILRQWQVGGDPNSYDWSVIDQPEDMDEESQRQREKERRAKERRERRQQREDELARAKTASQPLMFPRSSPGPMLSDMANSSQIPMQSQILSQEPISNSGFIAPQSQIEPGKFGGRLDKNKKKKKKRLECLTGYLSAGLQPLFSEPKYRYPISNYSEMSGFPSLQPAFTVRVEIDAPMQVGGQSGPQLAIVPMTSGTVKSEEGFEPKLDGVLHGVGYDYIHNDADGANMRLDVRSQVKNHDGTVLAMYYKGTVKLTPSIGAILTGAPDAKTTEYGDSFVSFSFETGNPKYAELQNGTYVAAGHFVKEAGKPGTIVEYKVSKVVYKA